MVKQCDLRPEDCVTYSLGALGAKNTGSTSPSSGLYLSYNRIALGNVWYNALFWKDAEGEVSGIAVPIVDASAPIKMRIGSNWV